MRSFHLVALCALSLAVAPFAIAAPSAQPSAQPLARAAASSSVRAPAALLSARPLSSSEQAAPPPPGHPTMAPSDDENGDDDEPHAQAHGDPHGELNTRPPQSSAHEDPLLPPHTIVVDTLDAQGKPLPNVDITLGIVKQSVAQGESRQRLSGSSGASGTVTFAGLDVASGTAFRISTVREGATYAAPPFQMGLASPGMRVSLYVFPVTTDARVAHLAAQGLVYVEIKDEVIQIEQAFRLYNLGTTTWLASDVPVDAPTGFKAFNSQQGMSDLAWNALPDKAMLRFRGTVPPGQSETAYRFQVPYDGGDTFEATLGLLPNLQTLRIVADAPRGMRLNVEGFPEAQATVNANGQRVLLTEKAFPSREAAIRKIRIRLESLPTRSTGRWYAVLLAVLAVGGGVVATQKMRRQRGGGLSDDERDELEQAKEAMLREVDELEQAHAAGEIGPKTYARQRAVLVDTLAAILARLEPTPLVTHRSVENLVETPGG